MGDQPAASGLDADFVADLICPVTRQPLRMAGTAELAQLKLSAALVRNDGLVAYPIHDGIPLLLPEAGISLAPS